MREGWGIRSLPDCLEKSAKATKVLKKHFKSQGKYPIISQEKGLINGYWDDENEVVQVDQPFVLFGDHTRVVKFVDFDFVVGADGVKILKPKSFLEPRYFYYFLIGHPLKGLGYARHFRLLKELNVPVAPLPEQKRIVAILNEAFAGIDTAIANTEKNLANARELFESYLNSVFSQRGEGWIERRLGDVCIFEGGSQPPKSDFSKDLLDGYIRLIQIRDYKSDKNIVYIPKSKARRLCGSDDIMIGRYGPPLFQILRGINGAYNVALMKATPKKDVLIKDYLYYFLKNKDILNYVINSSSRAAGQAGVNKATLEPYPIAYPHSLQDQSKLVEDIEKLSEEIIRVEAIYQQKLTALAELKQSLLQKAFSGELTADPADAMATVEAASA